MIKFQLTLFSLNMLKILFRCLHTFLIIEKFDFNFHSFVLHLCFHSGCRISLPLVFHNFMMYQGMDLFFTYIDQTLLDFLILSIVMHNQFQDTLKYSPFEYSHSTILFFWNSYFNTLVSFTVSFIFFTSLSFYIYCIVVYYFIF